MSCAATASLIGQRPVTGDVTRVEAARARP
jgi:hypothetical protein